MRQCLRLVFGHACAVAVFAVLPSAAHNSSPTHLLPAGPVSPLVQRALFSPQPPQLPASPRLPVFQGGIPQPPQLLPLGGGPVAALAPPAFQPPVQHLPHLQQLGQPLDEPSVGLTGHKRQRQGGDEAAEEPLPPPAQQQQQQQQQQQGAELVAAEATTEQHTTEAAADPVGATQDDTSSQPR